MAERPTLVIGDVHGHVDRLQALLEQEGVIANGKRVNDDVRVVQVGDLGHFGVDLTADEDCYREALGGWIDTLLWGNHDRAVFDNQHIFGGYRAPIGPVKTYMAELQRDGRYKFADHAHGYLLTHAGVARYFDAHLPSEANLPDVCNILNNPPAKPGGDLQLRFSGATGEPHPHWAVVNAIGSSRGGWSRFGGILWRDIGEPISNKFNQVFGHSADPDGLVRHLKGDIKIGWRKLGTTDMADAWCVDIGGKYENRLAGIWLPEMRVVKVDLDA